jgi:hypothetical protein
VICILETNEALIHFKLDKIADALNVAGAVDSLLVVITGDIAYFGHREQYNTAICAHESIINLYRKAELFRFE